MLWYSWWNILHPNMVPMKPHASTYHRIQDFCHLGDQMFTGSQQKLVQPYIQNIMASRIFHTKSSEILNPCKRKSRKKSESQVIMFLFQIVCSFSQRAAHGQVVLHHNSKPQWLKSNWGIWDDVKSPTWIQGWIPFQTPKQKSSVSNLNYGWKVCPQIQKTSSPQASDLQWIQMVVCG